MSGAGSRSCLLLARLRGHLTLSYTGHDLSDDRDKFPSPQFLAAFRILSNQRTGSQEDILKWLGRPVSFAPKDDASCLDMKDWWLRQLCTGEPVFDAESLVLQSFPHLARGKESLAQRASTEFTPWDGRAELAGADLDPTHDGGAVMRSEIWKRAQQSERRFVEIPYQTLKPADPNIANSTPTVLRGVIDLAFREGGSWVIVDYKTDKRPEDRLPELVAHYRGQLASYADFWQATVGAPVLEKGLYFTHANRYVRV